MTQKQSQGVYIEISKPHYLATLPDAKTKSLSSIKEICNVDNKRKYIRI